MPISTWWNVGVCKRSVFIGFLKITHWGNFWPCYLCKTADIVFSLHWWNSQGKQQHPQHKSEYSGTFALRVKRMYDTIGLCVCVCVPLSRNVLGINNTNIRKRMAPGWDELWPFGQTAVFLFGGHTWRTTSTRIVTAASIRTGEFACQSITWARASDHVICWLIRSAPFKVLDGWIKWWKWTFKL